MSTSFFLTPIMCFLQVDFYFSDHLFWGMFRDLCSDMDPITIIVIALSFLTPTYLLKFLMSIYAAWIIAFYTWMFFQSQNR